VQEAFSGIRVLKAYRREEDSGHKFEAESNQYLTKSLNLTHVNALFFPLVTGLIGLSTILTVYVGGILVDRGEITTGNIAEFVIYINMLTWPVTSLGWVTSIVQRAAASQERINAFLYEKPEIVGPDALPKPLEGNISFREVWLTYPDSGIEALKGVDFDLHAGQSLAIVGGLGSGKSTIANMICRLYDPSAGSVLIDGENLKNINLHSLREQVAYVPQDVFLFSDTISKNIAFGKDDATQQEIEDAARWAGVYDNIMAFPKGFETIIGERGITLSGGQKQRVAIARALIRQPKILILDDCLSAVDTHTENEILNHLKVLMKNRSTLIISHRISSVKLADRILVLADGKIVEQGTHRELLRKKGVYREIYDKQLLVEEAA
jgi:ATP-binding cassette subfamily B protein